MSLIKAPFVPVVVEPKPVIVEPVAPVVVEPPPSTSRVVTDADGSQLIDIGTPVPTFTRVEEAMLAVFNMYNLPRLGGASGDRGWSSFSTYQRCPYLYKRYYLDKVRFKEPPSASLETGSMFHALLAVKYQKMMQPDYPITPESLVTDLMKAGCNPESIFNGQRIFLAHESWWAKANGGTDYIIPLEVEAHAVDPETRESCRYDAIVRVENAPSGIPNGIHVLEHKSAFRIDENVDAWRNDGEVLGQLMLFKRLKLEKKYGGKLRGTIMNIVSKAKEPKCFRYFVEPKTYLLKQHAEDLKYWAAAIEMSRATGIWARSRAACVNKFGKCSQFAHCADRED